MKRAVHFLFFFSVLVFLTNLATSTVQVSANSYITKYCSDGGGKNQDCVNLCKSNSATAVSANYTGPQCTKSSDGTQGSIYTCTCQGNAPTPTSPPSSGVPNYANNLGISQPTSFESYQSFVSHYSIDYEGDPDGSKYAIDGKNKLIHIVINGIPNDLYMANAGIFYDIELQDYLRQADRSAYAQLTFAAGLNSSDTAGCLLNHFTQESSIITHDVWQNEKCTEANGVNTFEGDIKVSELFHDNPGLDRRYKLVIRVGRNAGSGIDCNADNGSNCLSSENGTKNGEPIAEIDQNFHASTYAARTCFTATTPNGTWVVPGDVFKITIDHALTGYDNSQYDESKSRCVYKQSKSVKSALYRFGFVGGKLDGSLAEHACTTDTCVLSYPVPSDALTTADSEIIVAGGLNGDQDTSKNDNFENAQSQPKATPPVFANIIQIPGINVDKYWQKIIDGDSTQNGRAARCNQADTLTTPNCSSLDQPVNFTPLKCHGNDLNTLQSDHTYVCDNWNQYLCYQNLGNKKYKRICAELKSGYNRACAGKLIPDKNNDLHCEGVNSPIGLLPSEPQKLVTKIFGLLLSLAGGIALFMIIAAGYKIMTSQGNPEAIQGARDQLTSAITGLLFIIFSMVLFEIITANLLHIPGFS